MGIRWIQDGCEGKGIYNLKKELTMTDKKQPSAEGFRFTEDERKRIHANIKGNGISVINWRDDAIDYIESLISSRPASDGWISVETELPNPFAPVLIAFGDNEAQSAYRTGCWCGDSWVLNGSYPILTNKITHWQPLPSPPKQQEG